jgi:hypothetical protein
MSALAIPVPPAGCDGAAYEALRARPVQAKLLYPMGVTGLYGHSVTYQSILDAIDALVTRWGSSLAAERMYFPPGARLWP